LSLRRARDYYYGSLYTYNELWRHIAAPFKEYVTARIGDAAYTPDLYVTERVSRDGLEEADLIEYVDDPLLQRLLIVEGPAGIGKTTFVTHCMAKIQSARPELCVAWADFSDHFEMSKPQECGQLLLSWVASTLEEVIKEHDEHDWFGFLLANLADPTGSVRLLRSEFERSKKRLTKRFYDQLFGVLERVGKVDLLSLVRIKLEYLRAHLKSTPLIIVDNLDQLPTKAILSIAQMARSLAEDGLHGLKALRGGKERCRGWAKVIIAMRPVTAGVAQQATGRARKGILQPPSLPHVLRRRLVHFLASADTRLLRKSEFVAWASETLRDQAGEPQAPTGQDELLRQRFATLTTLIAGPLSGTEDLGSLLHRLTYNNTRLSLLATTLYVASGHLDMPSLTSVVAGDKHSDRVLTKAKALRALLLGVGAIYVPSIQSWLYNLLNDSCGGREGLLSRPRLLKMVSGAEKRAGAEFNGVMRDYRKLFEYDDSRTHHVVTSMFEFGLIEERGPKQVCATVAGETYLGLIREFEYMQHVAIDVPVDDEHLVRCTSRDETSLVRIRRLAELASWAHEVESADLRRIASRGNTTLYRKYFDDSTVTNALVSMLTDALRFLPHTGPESTWREVQEIVQSLAQASRLNGMVSGHF
jgi:hypothetical protein